MDVAVVHQKCVGQFAQPLTGFLVAGGDGFLAQVAAGHHQRLGETGLGLKQQIMQRRVGQHHAQGGLAGCRLGCDGGIRAFVQDDDRSLARKEQFLFHRVHIAVPRDAVQVWHHQGEGFVDTQFATA